VSEGKYLTYTPWPGQLNNTRMCFETALVLAYFSNRCLVMPELYKRNHQPDWEAGSFKPLHPQEYFEMENLNRVVQIVSFDEFNCRRREWPQEASVELTFEPGSAVFCFPVIPDPGSPEALRLLDFAAGRQRFLEFTAEMRRCRILHVKSPSLEHFYSFFYFLDTDDGRRSKQLVRDHVRFKPEIIATAARIAALLGRYGAVHVRRNDFFLQYGEQNLPADQILYNLESHLEAGSRLYIATDEPDKGFFSPIRSRYETYFLQNFESAIPAGTPAASLACIEQMICAFAHTFLGTRLSTFSGYITRLRGYYGAPDKNVYFTDGFPGSDMDEEGSPPFSWINWIRRGNPWWGREFREGWEIA
jgi:hypothetical protein